MAMYAVFALPRTVQPWRSFHFFQTMSSSWPRFLVLTMRAWFNVQRTAWMGRVPERAQIRSSSVDLGKARILLILNRNVARLLAGDRQEPPGRVDEGMGSAVRVDQLALLPLHQV